MKHLLGILALAVVTLTTACVTVSNVRLNEFNPACAYSDRECRLGIKARWDFVHKTAIPGQGSIVDVLSMLTNQFYITIATSRAHFVPTSGAIDVRLTLGATAVAQTSASWYRSGNRIYLSDPSALRAWVESYGDSADGISLDFPAMEIGIDGSDGQLASVTFIAEIGGIIVASGTSSGIIDSGGCRFGPCEEQ